MTKHPRVYPPEFRHKVLELIAAGKSANAVAIEFNISRQTLTNWIKQDAGVTGSYTLEGDLHGPPPYAPTVGFNSFAHC